MNICISAEASLPTLNKQLVNFTIAFLIENLTIAIDRLNENKVAYALIFENILI